MPNITGYCTYTTQAGDTFDLLSLDMYDDEKMAEVIIAANPDYSDTIIFAGGIDLKLPILDGEVEIGEAVAPWRR